MLNNNMIYPNIELEIIMLQYKLSTYTPITR